MSTVSGCIKVAATATILAYGLASAHLPAFAEALTAKTLMDMQDDRQRYMFIAGIVAGLSTARYVHDGNDTGSTCIENWFYDTDGIRDTIYETFRRFEDKSPSAIILALATRKCGK